VNLFSLPCSAGSGIRKDRVFSFLGSFPLYGSHCEDRAARLCVAWHLSAIRSAPFLLGAIRFRLLGWGGVFFLMVLSFFEAGDEKPGNPSSHFKHEELPGRRNS
jgi:hypothetical protein